MVRTVNGDWLIRARDGRLGVYATRDEAVWCRAERRPGGGTWLPWRKVGGDQRLHPGLAVGHGADGYAHLVSWRPTKAKEAGLAHSTHFRVHLAALDWSAVGHPDRTGARTGIPAVAVDAEGRAHVFVGNRGNGVHALIQKERGGWNAWSGLKGSDVHEELAAVTGESGRVELYGTNPDGILRWLQEEAGAPPVPADPLPVRVEPGTLSALSTSKEHTTLFFADPEGMLHAWRPDTEPTPCSRRPAPARRPCSAAPWTATTARCSPSVRPPAGSPSPRVRRSRSRRACGGRSPDRSCRWARPWPSPRTRTAVSSPRR